MFKSIEDIEEMDYYTLQGFCSVYGLDADNPASLLNFVHPIRRHGIKKYLESRPHWYRVARKSCCDRCGGHGVIPKYMHVLQGACLDCNPDQYFPRDEEASV